MAAIFSPATTQLRRGFILTEALIALLIFTVVFLALEGSLTLVVRRFADATREDIAARHAEIQREAAFANGCTAGLMIDSLNGVVVSSTSTTADYLLRIVQTTAYPRKLGARSEHYDAVSRCR
ncbi:MAG: type II secretion system protein [Gemmatimonadaceae bacterium]